MASISGVMDIASVGSGWIRGTDRVKRPTLIVTLIVRAQCGWMHWVRKIVQAAGANIHRNDDSLW